MTSMKAILIDGRKSIVNKKHFLRDDIPRFLANCIDLGYTLWLMHDKDLNYDFVPMWLQKNITPIDLNNIQNVKFDKDSFILTDNSKKVKNSHLKELKINTVTLKDIGLPTKYYPIKIADLILCFGFKLDNFIDFCDTCNFIGIIEDEIAIKNKNPQGVAYLVDSNINFKEQFFRANNFLKMLIKDRDYHLLHKNRILGVTDKGKGLENVTIEDELQLLMV